MVDGCVVEGIEGCFRGERMKREWDGGWLKYKWTCYVSNEYPISIFPASVARPGQLPIIKPRVLRRREMRGNEGKRGVSSRRPGHAPPRLIREVGGARWRGRRLDLPLWVNRAAYTTTIHGCCSSPRSATRTIYA